MHSEKFVGYKGQSRYKVSKDKLRRHIKNGRYFKQGVKTFRRFQEKVNKKTGEIQTEMRLYWKERQKRGRKS